jgi:hypothetical protein
MALSGMGYPDDGDTVLRWVIETHKLDADWASWICQHMATDAMYRVDFDAAQRWADESDAIDAEPKAWGAKVKASIFYYRHEWSTLRKTLRGLAEMELPALQRAHADSLAAVDLAHRGRAKDARRAFDGVELPADVPLEMLLHWKAVGAAIDLGAGLPVDWQEVVLSVTALLRERDGGLLSSWDHLPLLRLVELADEAGSPDAATSLMRLRYLDSARAAGAENRLLGLCRAPSGLLLIEATEAARVDRLRTSQVRFRLLVKEAQRELQSGRSMSAVRQLAELLVPRVEGNTSPVWIGSDGLLAGAPMNAISMVARGERSEGQAFRVLAGHRTPPPSRAAGCTDIVSIADSRGDLPWASREVMRSEASLWARGKAAVKQCLDLEAPCGLLHLGVHSRRELGVPQLMFANGPMGPLDIARLSLPGAPVVLLAGCFTGTAKTDKGVERSLADSFSRAGASAVIATQWAVEDREMHQFVRRVVEAWPFADAASRVAEICCALRSEGLPARCWAAPVVY